MYVGDILGQDLALGSHSHRFFSLGLGFGSGILCGGGNNGANSKLIAFKSKPDWRLATLLSPPPPLLLKFSGQWNIFISIYL